MNFFLNVQVKGVYNERRVVIERRPGVDYAQVHLVKQFRSFINMYLYNTLTIYWTHSTWLELKKPTITGTHTLNMVRTQETNHNCQKHVISDHSIRSNI